MCPDSQALWMKPDGAELAEIMQWIEAGKVKPIIDKTYPFEQVAQAFDYLADGHAKGKIIIHIADE